jgi:hypothetical protein
MSSVFVALAQARAGPPEWHPTPAVALACTRATE